ncbi:two-component system sporulation sensor kinase B [Bacillus ectoiniformans]|nr:two-component system sporulation sensor kinase B [Bacillus ectoiniformans]
MLFLTMSFPVQMDSGFHFDVRIVPVIIATLYGGPMQGLIVIAAMFIYRTYLDQAGLLVSLLNYTIAFVLLVGLYRRYNELTLLRKNIFVSLIYWLIAGNRAFQLYNIEQHEYIDLYLLFTIIIWCTLLVVISFIENLNEQLALQKQIQRSEKMSVVSQLAASVAHEVRNPMTSIRGFMQLMYSDNNINDTQRKYIDISLEELDRVQLIINDYLSLAKPNTKIVQPINLSIEMEKVIELMRSYTNIQSVIIESNIQDQLFVKGNQGEIKQVLINLIKNGIEATGNNGRIQVNSFREDKWAVIEIIDNGKGMCKNQIDLLGTPFYSTKDLGTGVGLTISYQIIDLMKGKIEVESEVGKGTKFTIKLPICFPDKPSVQSDHITSLTG